MKNSKPAPGFTLLEGMVCIWLLSTVLFLLVPHVERSMERRWMEELVGNYLADYAYAQSLAISQGVHATIQFVPEQYFYMVRLRNTTVKKVSYHRRIRVDSNLGLPYPHGVRFDNRGYVHQGGTITLSGKYEKRRLIIQLVTGRIRVEKE